MMGCYIYAYVMYVSYFMCVLMRFRLDLSGWAWSHEKGMGEFIEMWGVKRKT